MRARLAIVARHALAVLVAVELGVWMVAALDAARILALGASAGVLGPVHRLALGVGGLAAVCACALLGLLWPLGLAARRWLGWAPSTPTAAALGLAVVAGLIPVHDTLVVHSIGTVMTTAYAAFPAALAMLAVDRVRRTSARPWLWALPLLAVAVALHVGNAQFFSGLYPMLHKGLTLVTLVVTTAAAVLVVSGLGWRPLGVTAALLGLSAVVAGPFEGATRARGAAFVHGTELAHLFDLVERFSDADADDLGARLGGADCDDENPEVHGLRYEIPGNGVDDNCRLGDAAKGAQGPRRTAPAPKGLAAWREANGQPDVVLLFVDTLRWDFLDPERTPRMARFAEGAVRFTQARGTAPRTPHAWMAMLRGRFVGRVLSCRRRIEPAGRDTLLGSLGDAGYKRWGRLVGRSWKTYQLADGYERLIERDHVSRVSGPNVTRDAIGLMRGHRRKHREEPMLLVAHYADAHAPYKAHDAFPAASDDLRDRYAAEVRATDHEVGRLLDEIRRVGRPTLVVVFADHGENLGDHGGKGGHHGVSVYDEVVRVPLLVGGPGIAPHVVDDPVSLVDVAPTLVELLGGRPLSDPDGRSLAGYLLGEPPQPSYTISEFYDFGYRLRALVDGPLKLVVDERRNVVQLFDVVADPAERYDLAASRPDDAARLRSILDAWVELRADPVEAHPERCKDLSGRKEEARRGKRRKKK